MTNTEKAINLIEWLVNESGVTAYRIGKDTGLSVTVIDRIKKHGNPVSNLSLATAWKLEEYATKLKLEGMNEMEMVQNRKNEVVDENGFEDIFENEVQDFREHIALVQKYGSVESEHGKLALLQHPHITGVDEGCYEATAVSDQGDRYNVVWDIKEGMEEHEDEQERCVWDNPSEINSI